MNAVIWVRNNLSTDACLICKSNKPIGETLRRAGFLPSGGIVKYKGTLLSEAAVRKSFAELAGSEDCELRFTIITKYNNAE